jgi:hypothetical protein
VSRRTCIVILEVPQGDERQVVGVVVDAVSEVLDIPMDDIEPPPAFGTRIRRDFIAGMGKVRERFVILLNAEQALAMDELVGLEGRRGRRPIGRGPSRLKDPPVTAIPTTRNRPGTRWIPVGAGGG